MSVRLKSYQSPCKFSLAEAVWDELVLIQIINHWYGKQLLEFRVRGFLRSHINIVVLILPRTTARPSWELHFSELHLLQKWSRVFLKASGSPSEVHEFLRHETWWTSAGLNILRHWSRLAVYECGAGKCFYLRDHTEDSSLRKGLNNIFSNQRWISLLLEIWITPDKQ